MELIKRPVRDLLKRPAGKDLLGALFCYAFMVTASILSSHYSGFPQLMPAPYSSIHLWAWIAFLFVTPGIMEEVLFRSLILRFRNEVSAGAYYLRLIVSQIAFIAWHPLILGHIRAGRAQIFSDPRFLLLAALIGIASSFLYLRSKSLWPSIFFHWAVASSWYLFGGGFTLLHPGV